MTRLPAAPARLIAGAVLVACVALPAWAQSPDEPEQAGEIASFTLDNGLEIVVIPDHRAPVVTHMLWYKVGSADEEPGKSGIAHFLEHLMFKGTEEHPQGEFSQTIAEVGGRENAFTSYDYTAYYQQVPPELLETMMEFEADRMTGLVLSDEVVAPERQVVIEERSSRVENQPGALLSEALDATLYKNHPYGQPVIGWMHEIKALNRQDAIEFYQRYYAPNNAILVVAGDVEPETVRELAEETYGEIPANPELGPRVRPEEPPHRTARTVTYTDSRVTVPSFTENWVVPSYNTAEDGTAEALDLLSEILGGGVHSRLYRSLVVEKGIASSAGAFYRGNALDDSAFGVYGTPRGGADLADVEQAVRAEIEKIVEEGVSEEELEAAKNRFVRSMIFARDSQQGMANIYGSALATGSTIEDVQEWPERIRAVDAEAVQAAAARFLDDDRSVTGYLLPEKVEEAEGDE